MNVAKDNKQNIQDNMTYSVGNHVAYWISAICSPPLLAIIAIGLGAHFSNKTADFSAIYWTILYVLLSVIPPCIYILYLKRKGSVGDFNITIRKERFKPLFLILLNTIFAFIILYLLRAPELLLVVALTAIVQLSLFILITRRWKISGHCAAISTLSTLGVILFSTQAMPIIALIPAVAWSRVKLNCHTIYQSIAGIVLGSISIAIVYYFAIV